MPRALARFFTASSSGSGKRILTRAAFFSNSNRTGIPPERSYSARLAVSTNRSASWSVRKFGIVFFILLDLLSMHVAGTYRTDETASSPFANCKNKKDVPALIRLSNCPQPLLVNRMENVRQQDYWACEEAFDFFHGHSMFLTFLP